MAEYQVWHKDGETYHKVADVRAHDPLDAVQLTQHGNEAEWEHDPNEGHWWRDSPGVDAAEGAHRSTTFDDIIITPDGAEYRIAAVEFDGRRDFGFQPTDTIRQQGYAECLDDKQQRDLYDRSVDFADKDSPAMLEAFLSNLPRREPSDYERALKAGIGRAQHQPEEPDKGPTL